jgi:hypothetical protein
VAYRVRWAQSIAIDLYELVSSYVHTARYGVEIAGYCSNECGTLRASFIPLLITEKVFMSRSMVNKSSQSRKANRLKDDVYREMFLLESHRPGSEMGLALALLRAVAQSQSLANHSEFQEWLKSVCTIGLHMIETSLAASSNCNLRVQ